MNKVYEFLKSLNIVEKTTVVVAVSYGPDSMALLDILRKKLRCNIVVAHVHHNHRKESDVEASKLEEYCNKNNIIFEMMKIEKYTNNKFTEDEARKIRYEFFDSVVKKHKAKYLFTAHHGDDLVETVLMRITRGSTLKGYEGINLTSERSSYSIIRPLLYVTKDDIINYCKVNKIPYAKDATNDSLKHTRNRYRNKLLPFLKEENKNIHLKYIDFSNTLDEYEKYVDKMVKKAYKGTIKEDTILIDKLLKKEDLIVKKVLEKYLFNVYKEDISLLSSKNLNDVFNMLKTKKSNITIDMPLNMVFVKSYDKLYYYKRAIKKSYVYMFDNFVELPNNYVIKRVKESNNKSNYTTYLSSKEIKLPLYVRNRNDGDRMEILNLDGSKKVKDILIDEKVDITKRDDIPILCDNSGNIIWMPGIKKSKYDKSKGGKYDIILRYVKKGDKYETK